MVGHDRAASRALRSWAMVSSVTERKRGRDPGDRRISDIRSLGVLDRPASRVRELTGARRPFYPVAPGIERGYDASTPRRLHRGAPSKTKHREKGGYSNDTRTVPTVYFPRFRPRLCSDRQCSAGAGASRPALLAARSQRRAGEIDLAPVRD